MASSDHVTLSNYDWQCHRLCEHLDHTLLHGLRHVTPGYWKIVSEFTHRDCVKEIKRMRNVTTDLGRGRAWLFMALNESLLECYMRCYQQNDNLVEEFYVKDALVRDQDRFNVLLTLAAGLESIEFRLDCDMPYLDLCVYPPNVKNKASMEAKVEFDKLSICSMESIHPGSSRPLPQTVFEKPERDRSYSQDSGSGGSEDFTTSQRYSPSIDSGVHSDWNYRQRSITPIIDQTRNSAETSQETVTANNPAELEVIRMTRKGKPSKNKKKKRKFVSVSSVTDMDEIQDIAEDQTGEKIKIPPIDDIKLSSAIMNSTKNDPHVVSLESEVTMLPDRKLPNNRTEECEIGNNLDNDYFGKSAIPSLSNDEPNDGKDSEILDSLDRVQTNKAVEGTFTDILRARADDIVNAGKSQNNKETLKDTTEETDTMENETDSGVVQYTNMMTDIKSKGIYDMEDQDNGENQDNGDIRDITDGLNHAANSLTDTECKEEAIVTPEEPSIYGHASDSDSVVSDEDDDDLYVTANSSKFSQNSHRSTPSRQSNTSTPSRGSNNNTPARFTPNESSKRNSLSNSHSSLTEGDKKDNFGSKISLTNQNLYDLGSANQESDFSDHDHLSNRNTPDFFTTTQKRPVSASSRSSMYDTEDDSRIPTSRPQSSQSINRVSPNVSIVSQSSNHSNQSTDPDFPGTEQQALHAKVEELIEQKKLYTRITFSDDEEEDLANSNPPVRSRTSSLRAGEVELDNNSMLYLSLDILQGDAETVIRMFCCRQGHTEGKTKTVFTLISTHALYILQEQGKRRFQTLATLPFLEIDFVSLGFHSQTLHIACKNKRQQYWLTTGDERVTVAMVDCLANSLENSELKPGKLEVDTECLAQKISLSKYITKECHCDPDEAEVVCYSLVHWEDPSSNTGSCEWDREGVLHYKSVQTTNILGTQTWRLGYAILRDGMLCLYNDKNDSKPTQFLSMSEGHCVGCKRDFNSDKNHSIKIILSDETTWCLSLNSEEEANRWLQGLCQAVSEGLKVLAECQSAEPMLGNLFDQEQQLLCKNSMKLDQDLAV